jgi:uncharacterized protein YoxC
MGSQIVFSFKDLLLFVLWGALVGVFAYLILILRRAYKVMKEVNLIIDDHRKEVDESLKVVPELLKNVDAITKEVAHDMGAFRGTVDNIAETTEAVTDTLNQNKSVVSGVSSFVHTLSIAKAFYDKFFGEDEPEVDDMAASVQKNTLD